MKKLINMVDFVLEQTKLHTSEMKMGGVATSLHIINNYARFLKRPLELGMFVPCDEDGNVLKESFQHPLATPESKFGKQWTTYKEAKERVIFEGCEVTTPNENPRYYIVTLNDRHIWYSNTSKPIENFVRKLTLTELKAKELGV